jgi:hypothetical protein
LSRRSAGYSQAEALLQRCSEKGIGLDIQIISPRSKQLSYAWALAGFTIATLLL